jgi:NAD(P)-dependent dehydrogenase (short-subunit alcohol dehydrogenase family)
MSTMANPCEFDGAVALITGAAGVGIGQAIARRLAAGGARVIVTDIHERRTKQVTEEMAANYPGTEVTGYRMDVGDRHSIDDVVQRVTDQYGTIDILVNNAAVNIVRPIFEFEPADWDFVMSVNIDGPWYLAWKILPMMRDNGGGVVLNIGSYAPDVGGAGIETAYAVSKGALNALTRSLAHEGGPHGIRVNCISMGVVTGTKFIDDHPELLERPDTYGPLGSLPDKHDIAELAAFLASKRARHITGEIVNLSAGAYMRN